MSIFEMNEVVLLTTGTVEYLMADITDESGELTNLTGTNPRFDLYSPTGTVLYQDQPATIDPVLPMRVRCLVDAEDWVEGDYKFFITLDTIPEIPRLGPYLFVVIA